MSDRSARGPETGVAGDGLRLHLRTRLSGRAVTAPRGSGREDFDRRRALRAFERAIRVAPADPDYHFVFGEALLQEGQYADALTALLEATRLHPREATYQLALGETLWRLGRSDEAARALRRACDLEPTDVDAWAGLGVAWAEVPLDSVARGALSKALELDRKRVDARNNLGVLLWRSGARDEALAALRLALRHDPRAAYAQLNLARMLAASGSGREAEKALLRAHRLAPGDPEPLLDLGDLQFAGGQRREAARWYEQALGVSPSCLEPRPRSRDAYKELLHEAIRGELSLGKRGSWSGLGLLDDEWRAVGRALPSLAVSRNGLALALSLAALAAAAYAGWTLGRPYLRHLVFRDDVAAVAQAPVDDDAEVRDRLRLAVRENGLSDRVRDDDCTIVTRPRTRTIECRYSVPLTLLPGYTRPLRLELRVEKFYLSPDETLFF